MRPAKLIRKVINDARGWVTFIDPHQQKEEFPKWIRGFRSPRLGMIGERDFGTKDRFSGYPSNVSYNITGATNASPIEITVTGHLFQDDDYVDIASVGGNTAANGDRQQITKTGANTFTIDGSTGNANWTSGGTVKLSMDFVGGVTPYIATELLEYEILATVDGRGNFRLWVRPVDESSAWDELTKVYQATVKTTPGASDTTVTLTGVTDILNVPVTASADQFQYYIAYNKTRANGLFVTTNTAAAETVLTSECAIGSDVLAWQATDEVVLYRMQGIYDVDLGTLSTFFQQGVTPHIRWLEVPEQNKVNLYLGSSAETPVMLETLRIQKGVNTIPGTPIVAATSLYKLQTRSGWYIDRAELTPVFASIGSVGTPERVSTASVMHADEVRELGEGIQITAKWLTYSETTSGEAFHHQRWYVTALYRGLTNGSFYEESDPIFRLYTSMKFDSGVASTGCPLMLFKIGLDLAKVSKSLAGFRFYMGARSMADLGQSAGDDGILSSWLEDPADYGLVSEFLLDTGVATGSMAVGGASNTTPIAMYTVTRAAGEEDGIFDGDILYVSEVLGNTAANGVWTVDNYTIVSFDLLTTVGNGAYAGGGLIRHGMHKASSSEYVYTIWQHFPVEILSTAGDSISANLGHTPDVSRTRLTPRFATKVTHTDGSAIVVDVDDRTARSSVVGQVPMDDSFPDLTTSTGGYRLKFDLGGKGDLVGLAFSLNQLMAFKKNWINFVDTQASTVAGDYLQPQLGDRTLKADVCSGRGIVETPIGMFWFGHNGIYFKAHGENTVQAISGAIQNFVDGSLLTSDGTPYMTPAYREAAVAGYDPFYKEPWWNVQVNVTSTTTEYINLRWHLPEPGREGSWWVRVLNADDGRANWFSQRKDGTLTVGMRRALLKYPNIDSDYPYQDAVSSVDAASDAGIETRIMLNLGSMYGLPNFGALYAVQLDFSGESSTGTEMFYMKVYPDGDEYLLDPCGIPFDGQFVDRPIGIERIGKVKDGWLDFYLPSGLEYRFKKWELSTITLLYTESTIIAA